MGSSILRCFSSYYGLIMWLISTRWPQRDKRPQGLDLLKLSLSGCFFFFFLSHLSLRERAEAQKAISRRVHNETDTRTLLLNLSERVWAVKYLWKLCCVCARARVFWRNDEIELVPRRTVRPWHSAAPCTPDLSRATHPPSFSWHILALRPGLSPE